MNLNDRMNDDYYDDDENTNNKTYKCRLIKAMKSNNKDIYY